MHRFIRLSALLGLLGTPVLTWAYFMQPSTLLTAMEFDGRPRTVSMQAHARMDDVYLSFWMNGAGEGRTVDSMKGKWNMTLDVAAEGTTARAKMEMIVYRETAYLRLTELRTNAEDDVFRFSVSALQKKWVAIPLEPEQAQLGGKDAFIAGVVEGMAQEGMYVAPEDVEEFLDSLVDAVLSLDHSKFGGGHAYSLKLKSGFMREALMAVESFLSRAGGGDSGLAELTEDPAIWEMESMVREAVNLHIKVNTDDEDDFRFAKFYLSFAHRDLPDTSFVTQGEVQRQLAPVYIAVPEDVQTMTLDELLAYLSDQDFSFWLDNIDANLWESDTEWMDSDMEGMDEWENGMWDESGDTWEDTGDAWESGDGWWDDDTWEPAVPAPSRGTMGCDALPDSQEYLFLTRKGICPPIDQLRGNRVNMQESAKRKRLRAIEEQRVQEYREKLKMYEHRAEQGE